MFEKGSIKSTLVSTKRLPQLKYTSYENEWMNLEWMSDMYKFFSWDIPNLSNTDNRLLER